MSTPAENVVPFGTKPSATYVAVDPVTAGRWLEGNTVNRRVRQSKVNQYARDMAAGQWQLSNDAIVFDRDGKLLNGQHRLNAVIQSGKTVVFLIVRNMPVGSMTIMDTGASRSAGDAFKFIGEHNTSMLAAVAKQCLLYTDGRIYRDNKVQSCSHSELIAFVESHPAVRRSITEVGSAYRSIDAPASVVVTAHWIISRVNEFPVVTHYIHQLASRTNEPDGSAVLAVDSRLREVRRNRTQYPPRNFVYLLVKGWNYYARGEQIRSLAMRPRGQFKIPDPIKWDRP